MPGVPPAPARGRHAEARRNDRRILEAALDVFSDDLHAPMSAVAQRAGVGQASLYRRYPSKEALLARVCRNGMEQMQRAARSALESSGDPWDALSGFLHWYLESGTPRLAGLLGSFTPADDLFDLARDTNQAIAELVERNVRAGRVRSGLTGADLTLIVTQLSRLTAPDPDRAAVLRRRYLTLLLDGMARLDAPRLPGPAPDAEELERPWVEAARR
jgi:AcrR family transcriptional regulator